MMEILKPALTITLLFMTPFFSTGQNIYIKTFGNKADQPIIFLHGGPGYNCATFEASTAQPLADNGFFVIVYDRRGEGRSDDKNAKFTFSETFDDLNGIYRQYQLKNTMLIGHSFGGMVATLYAQSNPEKVQCIVLVGAPVSLQASFRNIIARSAVIYASKNDSMSLKYISMFEKMDTASLQYATYSFAHAMQNKFYSPKNPTEEAKKIHASLKTDTLITKYASKMTQQPTQGFWENEHYTTINLTDNLKKLQTQGVKIYGIYGKDDGLYSTEQVMGLQNIIGTPNLKYLDNCSHSVFTDRQSEFIAALKMWAKK